MQASDFDRIDSELGLRLPETYRRSLAPFPISREAGNSDALIWDDAEALIELNREIRSASPNWPSWLFVVGRANGDPSCHAIDSRDPEASVWWLDHSALGPHSGPNGETFIGWLAIWTAEAASLQAPWPSYLFWSMVAGGGFVLCCGIIQTAIWIARWFSPSW